jgi:hypothetical protein
VAVGGIWLEFGLALLAEQGWPPCLRTDGGKARCMLAVLAVNLRMLGFTLLPGLPQRHGSSFLSGRDAGKLDERTGLARGRQPRPIPCQVVAAMLRNRWQRSLATVWRRPTMRLGARGDSAAPVCGHGMVEVN